MHIYSSITCLCTKYENTCGTYISFISIHEHTCGTYNDIIGREEAGRIMKSGLACDAPALESVRG
jgi:hypothetical protein